MKYIIVNHGGVHWSVLFRKDPKITGLSQNFSVSSSYSGIGSNIKPYYTDKRQAEEDCLRINQANPAGDYGVCPLID